MFKILPENDGNILAIEASGKLTPEDYEQMLIPQLNELFAAHKKLRIMIVFADDFACWSSPEAMWDDAKIGLQHPNDFERIALVGAPDWVQWGMKIYSLFVHGAVKSFPRGDEKEAMAWLKM